MQKCKLNKKFVQNRRIQQFNKRRLGSLSTLSSNSKIFNLIQHSHSPKDLLPISAFVLVTTFISLGLTLSSSLSTFATGSNKVDLSLEVTGSCTVSNTNNVYTKEIGTGSFAEIGSGNVFDIYCNDEEGYVVYAVGNGKDIDSGDGLSKEGVTDLIGTNDTSNVIHTGTAQSGDTSGWSFKLSNATAGMVIEDNFSDNALIPSTRTKVVSRPSSTAIASGDNFTATYSAYISPSQKNDTYSGGVKYILYHPSSTVFYEINYNLNSGSWTGNLKETGTESGGYVNISSILPTKSGYDFKGWCNTEVTNNDSSNPTCSGKTYQAGNGVELPDVHNIINLYAIWQSSARSYTINYKSNKSGASNLPSTQTGSVTSPYSVTLSSDTPTLSGYTFKGWCTSSTSTESCSGTKYQPGSSINITSNGQTINLYAMWEVSMQGFSCNLANGSSTTITDGRDNTTYKVAKLADGKCWMTENLKIQNKTLTDKDSDLAENATFTLPSSTSRPNSSNSYSSTELHVDEQYGGYYTWYTATARKGTQGVKNGTNVEHSICPKGWRLPTKQDFIDLDKALGGTGSSQSNVASQVAKYTGAPNNFLMGGYYGSGNSVYAGSGALYWSSTAYSNTNAYALTFLSSHVTPQNNGGKNNLYSVRCVSRQ